MTLANLIQILIYIHAALGGIALLAGAVALVVKKGSPLHKKAGRIFFYTMLISAFIALIVAMMPKHGNPFLFSIGVFSMYFLISGYRSLKFKQKDPDLKLDKLLAYGVILTGLTMILYPILLKGGVNIILLIFGLIGLSFGLRDLQIFRDLDRLRKSWLKLHLGKMTGGYIAAVSAFFVVNNILSGILNWFVPTIIGSIYIAYSIIQLNKGNKL